MRNTEEKYQQLVAALAHRSSGEKVTIASISKESHVGYLAARRFADRLYEEGRVDEEAYPVNGNYPYEIALKELKRTKRYGGSAMAYALPLGADENGRRLYPLKDLQSLFLEETDGATEANIFRVLITSLVVAGSLRKPRFLLIDLKRVTFDRYSSFLNLLAPVIKEGTEALKILKAIQEKPAKKTPVVILIPEVGELLIHEPRVLPLLKRIANKGASQNLYLLASERRGITEEVRQLKKACHSKMLFDPLDGEATLDIPKSQPRLLRVPTLDEDQSLEILKNLLKQRSQSHE